MTLYDLTKVLNDAEILMLMAKDDCIHVGIGEIDVNSNTRII